MKPNPILLTGTAVLAHPEAKGKVSLVLGLLFIGVFLILLLACANVGNLLLARAAARQREIATRLSLGASRPRLIRQLLTEGLVLALISSGFGFLLACLLPSLVLRAFLSDPVNLRLNPDTTVLGFSIAISVLTCLLFGLAPALHATRINIGEAMKEGVLTAPLALRSVLLSGQVAISIVLLVTAALLLRGIEHAQTVDPGFPVNSITVTTFDLPANAYNPARIQTLLANLEHALDARQMSAPYGLARTAPLPNGHYFTNFHLAGEEDSHNRLIQTQEIAADYFGVLGLPILSGRNLVAADTARKVIVVNKTFSQRYFNRVNPLGKSIVLGRDPYEIVGVVKDAHLISLDSVEPLVFLPISGRDMPQLLTRDSSVEFRQAVQGICKHLDARVLVHFEPLHAQFERYLAASRAASVLASVLGLLALALASVGMFGVFSYVVRQRTQEIGIRMALGAKPGSIVQLILGASSRALTIGLALGFLFSFGASRALHRFLYGLSSVDPLAYGGVCLILTLAALAATALPTWRATRVDPACALRYE